ncbi:hypothetical protein D3C86_1219700 [compost metagenome]
MGEGGYVCAIRAFGDEFAAASAERFPRHQRGAAAGLERIGRARHVRLDQRIHLFQRRIRKSETDIEDQPVQQHP